MHGEAEHNLCQIKSHLTIDFMRLCTSIMGHWRATPGEGDNGSTS